jgi:cytochrome c-type biogenesis protein CcmH
MRAAATRSSRGALAGLALAAMVLFVGVPGPGTAADPPAASPAPAPATLATAAPSDTGLLTTPEQRARYQALAEQLRCLVCQNQTLADSNAELAADLRRQVETMILAGRNDGEIKSFLVERYGDFVLYRPPMQQNTWLLWIGPFALLVIGALVWWRIQGRGRAGEAPDLERARRLLDE